MTPKSDPSLTNFSGDVNVSRELPSKEKIEEAAEIPILDSDGKERPFKTLYTSSNAHEKRRVLIIFVRHFFCGNCQEYLRVLSSSLPSPSALPAGTSLAIIGCGGPSLINMYKEATACQYPIYTDPSRRLYKIFEMICTLNLGNRNPHYIRHSLMSGVVQGIIQALKRVYEGDVFKSGDIRQVGGEFLFEITGEVNQASDDNPTKTSDSKNDCVNVTWCHRMANTRDHSEVEVIRRILGFNSSDSGEKETR